MRFVSINPLLGLGTARKEKFVLALDGQRDLTQESLPVQFTQEYLTQEDIDFALSYFKPQQFRGRYLEADEVTLEQLDRRIGVFDTVEEQSRKGWSDEERELVERFMQTKPNYGQDFVEVVPVEKEVTKPWPSYSSTHHFKIPTLAAELGLIDEALAYEKANKNRSGVIEALEEQKNIRPKPEAEEAGEIVAA